jgi:hypothetical protein
MNPYVGLGIAAFLTWVLVGVWLTRRRHNFPPRFDSTGDVRFSIRTPPRRCPTCGSPYQLQFPTVDDPELCKDSWHDGAQSNG